MIPAGSGDGHEVPDDWTKVDWEKVPDPPQPSRSEKCPSDECLDLVILTFKGSINVLWDALGKSKDLEVVRERLRAAGLDAQPAWANKAMLLTSVSHARAAERIFSNAGIVLEKYNVVVSSREHGPHSQHEQAVYTAIQELSAKQRKPRLGSRSATRLTDPELQSRLVVKNTFVAVREGSTTSESGQRSCPGRLTHGNELGGLHAPFDLGLESLPKEALCAASIMSVPLSYNTGFTNGTAAFSGDLTLHARGRILERGLDEYLIRHTVARGQKTRIACAANGFRWRFEHHGVVVISNSEKPTQTVITAWFDSGFVLEAAYKRAQAQYDYMLQELTISLDEDDRVLLLVKWLEGKNGILQRGFYGVDLMSLPLDCPLLHWCAEQGYHQCVKILLEGDFQQALGFRGKKQMTVLHFAAWGGHPQVLEALGDENIRKLADIGNHYSELPEATALARHSELKSAGETEENLQRFKLVAIKCMQLRTGNLALTWSNVVEQASRELKAISPDSGTCKIPMGANVQDVMSCLLKPGWRCTVFQAQYLKLGQPGLGCLKQAMVPNFNLESLILETCGLQPTDLELLISFLSEHQGCIANLSLAGNRLGDDGISSLLVAPVLKIPKVDLSDTGLGPVGFQRLMLALEKGEPWKIQRLGLVRNDLSETQSTPAAEALHLALTQRHCPITHLELNNTRLTKPQLELVIKAARVSPRMHTLNLCGITLADEFASCESKQNPLLGLMADESCTLIRLEITIWQHPNLFKKLNELKRKRLEARSQRGKDAVKSHNGEELRLTDFLKVTIGSYVWDGVEDNHVMTLHTAQGIIPKVHDANREFQACDIGKSFEMKLKMSKLPNYENFQLQVLRFRLDKTLHNSFLSRNCIVYFRSSDSSILLFPKAGTESGRILLHRLNVGVIPDQFDVEQRFPGSGKKRRNRFSLEELMYGLRAEDFDDVEVKALATLHEPRSFEAFTGGQEKVRLRAQVLLRRLGRLPAISELERLFGQEKLRREQEAQPRSCSHGQYVLDSPSSSWSPACPGPCDIYFFHSPKMAVDNSLKYRFASSIGVQEQDVSFVRCIHNSGKKHMNLCFVDASALPDDNSGLLIGLTPYPTYGRQKPLWVQADMNGVSHLTSVLNFYTSDGYSSLPEIIVEHVGKSSASAAATFTMTCTSGKTS